MPRKAKKYIDLEEMDDEPPKIEPYTVLGLEKTATPDEIKAAYRKAALRTHPDKVPEDKKDEAHTIFQEIAFAYAILSDPKRRSRYDATGSTAESLEADGEFTFSQFYAEQFKDVITVDAIEAFSKAYKNSVEERDDVLAAYEKSKGKWAGIYETVMLSNCLEDEDRFRGYIDEAIEKGDVKAHKAYTNESAETKEARKRAARDEGEEAEEHAKVLGVHDKIFGKGGKSNGEDALQALILKRGAARGASFMEGLEAKYGAGSQKTSKGGKRGKKRASEELDEGEPSEEAFQAAQKRLKKGKENEDGGSRKSKRTKV